MFSAIAALVMETQSQAGPWSQPERFCSPRTLAKHISSPFFPPKNGSTLSQADLDSVYYDCYLFNNEAKAKPAFSYTVTFPYPHQAQVLFYGAVSNPLDAAAGPITWNVRTVINTSNPTAPTGYVNYNTTCFPAHEVQVDNGTPLFSYMPSTSATAYIATCLGLNGTTGINPIVGQTQPTAIH